MRIRKGLILREVAGENVVVATGPLAKTHRQLLFLNESGAVLWEMMSKDDFSVGQIEQKIVDRFIDADPQAVHDDLLEFINFLKEKDVLELEET